jgi:hypothetical protein
MPGQSLKPTGTTATAREEIVPYKPESDVTWGVGGIDDWGWTREPPALEPAEMRRAAA